MLRFLILLVGAVLVGELVRFGVNRLVGRRVSDVAGPAVALFVMLSVARHPGFGWREAPMGMWDVVLIAGVSVLGVTLAQFIKGRLFRRTFEPSTPGEADSS